MLKRCIALPGDTLEIRKGYYHIKRNRRQCGECAGATSDCTCQKGRFTWDRDGCFSVGRTSGMDHSEFGPLPVPAKGQVVKIDTLSCLLYGRLIHWGAEEETAAKRRGGMSG